jgi:cytochrome P450
MAVDTLLERITDYANRPDPYPLYGELRAAGVARQTDGSYLVGTYSDIVALLHDPQISADPRNLAAPYRSLAEEEQHFFIRLDDPEHQRVRSLPRYSTRALLRPWHRTGRRHWAAFD